LELLRYLTGKVFENGFRYGRLFAIKAAQCQNRPLRRETKQVGWRNPCLWPTRQLVPE
jgi:hypothetical protein